VIARRPAAGLCGANAIPVTCLTSIGAPDAHEVRDGRENRRAHPVRAARHYPVDAQRV